MSTFLSFHIKSQDKENVIRQLQELSNLQVEAYNSFPLNMYDTISLDMDTNPGILAIVEVEDGWVSVYHNSFNKLQEWGHIISEKLSTSFIQIIGQTNSDGYYFAIWEKGLLRREIEVMSMDGEILIDDGEKFSFEKEVLLTDDFEDPDNFFDMDTLDHYCKQFGLNITLDPNRQYYILSS